NRPVKSDAPRGPPRRKAPRHANAINRLPILAFMSGQTRKVLNLAWSRMRSFRGCTVDGAKTTRLGTVVHRRRKKSEVGALRSGRPLGERATGRRGKEQSHVNRSNPPHHSRHLPTRRLQRPIRRLWLWLRPRRNRGHRRHCHRGGRVALDGPSVGCRGSRAKAKASAASDENRSTAPLVSPQWTA